MNDQRARWDRRHAAGDETYGGQPEAVLVDALRLIPRGDALDLACGSGRHALFLATQGWQVTAVDGSGIALELLAAAATRRGCRASIDTQLCDLEEASCPWSTEASRFDLIAKFFYLHRALFPTIRDGVRPGGLFVAAIHVDGEGAAPHRFRLRRGELQTLVDGWGWETLHNREEGSGRQGTVPTAEIIARRPR
jgi:tellurite methyltransferase